MKKESELRVLMVAAEASPLIKIGGLGDVAGVLPKAIKALNPTAIDMRVILPYHQGLKQKKLKTKLIGSFKLDSLTEEIPCHLFEVESSQIPVYLISNSCIDNTPGVYCGNPADDAMKYMSFSLAVLEAAKLLDWQFDVLHANDWHTAVSVHLLKARRKTDPFFKGSKGLLTVHNMPYNGWGSQAAMKTLGIKPSKNRKLPRWARYTPLAMGLAAADKVVAVSKGYAEEILTEPFGSGLSEFMDTLGEKLTGIVNGIDTDSYNPATDKKIAENFSSSDLRGKTACKRALQELAGFKSDPDVPIFSIVSRLDNQKGIGLALDSISKMIKRDFQFVLLGTGAKELEIQAAELAEEHPEKIACFIRFDDGLARQLYAGADIFLMPSMYEPCGLSQMISMRYGNLPLAHAVGGLKDTIKDYLTHPQDATGFLYEEASEKALRKTMLEALKVFKKKSTWTQLQINAMEENFSWSISAGEYLATYQSLWKDARFERIYHAN
ncbi:MAG TPA: glycogen/starch synthase [Anaerolineaceae bacterium]|nr:glycogen/starch synthase [Anaerolineaceae bacterium]